MEWKACRRPREEGTGETPQRSEEAHGPPAGKRNAWNGNQRYLMPSCLSKSTKKGSHLESLRLF
ncbi:hypothetical protein EKQ44_10665 [Sutcliffiella horikoshii]|nr:hypothetical protein [Sutcliffiella horikoshii]